MTGSVYIQFAELFEHFSNTGELDPALDLPFRATMNSIHIGTTMLGRCDGTFTTGPSRTPSGAGDQ
ncbi:MAG: hypothetical protein WDN50_19875 [Bradyrhizobium sp.]